MKIDIQAEGIELDQKLREFTLCCAGFELGNFRQGIDAVRVRLANLAGSQRGRDQFCQVRVVFEARSDVVVEAIDIDLHVAIHWAALRVQQVQLMLGEEPDPGVAADRSLTRE